MKKTKILVVEDEMLVAYDIERTLESLGHKVIDCATNYDEALDIAYKNDIDIILMDINLNNSKDGIEIAESIKKFKNVPIIYLTASTDDLTIQRAIDTNPLAYLIKPFKSDELKSTIALGIHKSKNQNQKLFFGDNYYFDFKSQNLYYKYLPMKLSQKEKALLILLLEARGNLVTFDDIELSLWPDKPIAKSTLRSLICRLRSKLEHKFIETVPSFGCKLLMSF